MNQNRFLLLGLALGMTLTVSGCGNNIFDGVGKKESDDAGFEDVTDLTEHIENADSPEEFEQVADAVTVLLDDPEVTTSDAQELLLLRSKAVVGQNDLGVVQLVNTVADLDNEEDSNIFEIMKDLVGDVPSDELQAAAADINVSNTLSDEGGQVTEDNEQLYRGVVNAMVVNQMLTSQFNISEDEVTLVDDSESIVDIMEALFTPDTTIQPVDLADAVTPSLPYFYQEMQAGFDASDALPDDVQEDMDDIGDAVNEMERLNTAMQESSASFTVDGETFEVGSSLDPSVREENILAAINAIFSDVL
jgi:hypothetical protein